jgi:hypothetical protein
MSDREKALREFIGKWRDHTEPGSNYHASECCVDDLLDELEALLATPAPSHITDKIVSQEEFDRSVKAIEDGC